jgi:hypothetical protein
MSVKGHERPNHIYPYSVAQLESPLSALSHGLTRPQRVPHEQSEEYG